MDVSLPSLMFVWNLKN